MEKEAKAAVKTEVKASSSFSRQELYKSKRFSGHRDLVMALVAEDERLTVSQTEQRIDKFLKGGVK